MNEIEYLEELANDIAVQAIEFHILANISEINLLDVEDEIENLKIVNLCLTGK